MSGVFIKQAVVLKFSLSGSSDCCLGSLSEALTFVLDVSSSFSGIRSGILIDQHTAPVTRFPATFSEHLQQTQTKCLTAQNTTNSKFRRTARESIA